VPSPALFPAVPFLRFRVRRRKEWTVLGSVNDLIRGERLPRMLTVAQDFCADRLEDFDAALRAELRRPQILGRIRPGMRICITAGSREIDHMPDSIRVLGEAIRERGAEPFVIPAMGSHGGATAQGQEALLARYGITEAACGVPIRSTMEVVELARLDDGSVVWLDRFASEADGIIVLNRIKAHTGFRAAYESGLLKMMVVGLGKQKGAEVVHSYGPLLLGRMVEQIGRTVLARAKILFGVGLVENAYDRTHAVRCLTPEEIVTAEPELLKLSRSMMPQILFQDLDVLIVDRIGKNISGSGMDPNITKSFPYFTGLSREGRAKRIVVFDLTPETHGCAIGIGCADVTTRRLLDHMDFDMTYPNCLTSGEVESPCIPMVFDNQELAVKAAIKTLGRDSDRTHLRMARIRDTLHLDRIEISEALLPEAESAPAVRVLSAPDHWRFNDSGDLF